MQTPSKYQQAIFDFIRNGKGNAVVKARAGSGKTTTIVEALKMVPDSVTHFGGTAIKQTPKILFLAFNKDIATTLQERVPDNVEAATLNSFGWRVCLKNFSRIKLDAYKTEQNFKSLFDMDDKAERSIFYKNKGAINQIVSLLRAHICLTTSQAATMWPDLVAKYDIEFSHDPVLVVKLLNVYDMGLKQDKIMDFDDQIFKVIQHNLTMPSYDMVMIDEAQDLNPVQIEFVKRLGRNGRIVAVGDERQAIYGFRGADPDAIDNLIKATDSIILPLSICYRCPKSVIKLAQNIVPDIEHHESAAEGIVRTIETAEFHKSAKTGDYVLCRCTAPLVGECLKMIRNGKTATVKGRDIGKSLADLLTKIDEGQGKDLMDKIRIFETKEREKLSKKDNNEQAIQSLEDRVATLETLVMSTEDFGLEETLGKINQIFSDNCAGIVFCTVHRSKGLEADVIFILAPELMPHPAAKLPWQQKQELNLKYVAYTRAKKELYIINPEK